MMFRSVYSEEVMYQVRLWEVQPPPGYALNPDQLSAYYVCGAWRLSPDCDGAILESNTLMLVNQPGSYVPTVTPEPTPIDGEVFHTQSPLMLKRTSDGTLVDGAKVMFTFCNVVDGSCGEYGSPASPFVLNYDWDQIRNDARFEPGYSTTTTYRVTVTELQTPAGYLPTAPVSAWYICGAWRVTDDCSANVLPGNQIVLVNEAGSGPTPTPVTPEPDREGIIHHRMPYLFKVNPAGELISGAYWAGESCTKFNNEPDWTCISLYDYSEVGREFNQNYNWFNVHLDHETIYSTTPIHHLRIWEIAAPADYIMDPTTFDVWYVCGAWRLSTACDGEILPNNQLTFVNVPESGENPIAVGPTWSKIDSEGSLLPGAAIDGFSCTRWDNDLNWQCQSLDDYAWFDQGFTQTGTTGDSFSQGIRMRGPETPYSHCVVAWETSPPAGYQARPEPMVACQTADGWIADPSVRLEIDGIGTVSGGLGDWTTADNYVFTLANERVVPTEPTATATATETTTPVPTTTPTQTPEPTVPIAPTSTVEPTVTVTPGSTVELTVSVTSGSTVEPTPTSSSPTSTAEAAPTVPAVTSLPTTGEGLRPAPPVFIVIALLAVAMMGAGVRIRHHQS